MSRRVGGSEGRKEERDVVPSDPNWLVGVGAAPLRVEVGWNLDGYVARVGAADRVLDELRVGALVFERDGERLVLVAADVIGVDRELVDEVAAAAGVSRTELVICASHTHSGPAGVVARLHPAAAERRDPAMRARFVAACAAAIRMAQGNLEPATLRLGQAEAPGIAAKRDESAGRRVGGSAGPKQGEESRSRGVEELLFSSSSHLSLPADPPTGRPADSQMVTVLAVDAGGKTRAIVVHFACHPTVLGAESLGVSADFPGAMRRALAARLGDGAPEVLFVNGAAGDLSTRFTRRNQGYGEVGRLGGLLARAALSALASARPLEGPLRGTMISVVLPRTSNPGPGAAAEAVRLRAEAERIGASDATAAVKRQALTRAQGAELRLQLAGAVGIRSTAVLSGWQLGDLGLVTVPGELFASWGAAIAARSPYATTLVLGYTNGYVGYLVDDAAEATGTYEALASPYTPQAGRNLVEGAVEMLTGLAGGGWTLD